MRSSARRPAVAVPVQSRRPGTRLRLIGLCAAAFAAAGAARADIVVDFADSAPTDFFTIVNESICPMQAFELEIDLEGSAGRLIFDTTAAGAGVSVYQPFRLAEGAERVRSVGAVGDGDNRVRLALTGLSPKERVVFTIDVDDTLGVNETRVNGAEIAGAAVKLDGVLAARFNPAARAAAATPCAPTS